MRPLPFPLLQPSRLGNRNSVLGVQLRGGQGFLGLNATVSIDAAVPFEDSELLQHSGLTTTVLSRVALADCPVLVHVDAGKILGSVGLLPRSHLPPSALRPYPQLRVVLLCGLELLRRTDFLQLPFLALGPPPQLTTLAPRLAAFLRAGGGAQM